MNAGGVPNTCKSSGKAPAVYLITIALAEYTSLLVYEAKTITTDPINPG